MLAQDCIALCLRGSSGKARPESRPGSMAEVLSHPFFREEELELPAVPYHGSDFLRLSPA